MRVAPHLKTLITLATLATLAACVAPPGMYGPGGETVVSIHWDSGPLDRDYKRQHSDLVARHHDEDEHPQYDESDEQRHKRHKNEDKDLDKRYKKGRDEHRESMPNSDR